METETRARNIQINVRVTQAEFDSIKSLAKEDGLQVSEYLRFMLLRTRRARKLAGAGKVAGVLLCLVALQSCAPRYSIREIRDYRTGMILAQERGINTTAMQAKYDEMLISYVERPGVDSQDQAMSGMAAAQMMQAVNSNPWIQPQPYAPPMSPGQYNNAVRGR